MITFDWGSAWLGFVVGFCLAVVIGCFYFGLRSLRSRSSAGGYATFEDEAPREDGELLRAQERATQAVVASVGVPAPVLGPPVESGLVVRFGKVGDPHVYRAEEWDRPMVCVGQTCNQAPFVDGQRFYEIPVADDDTVLLVCVDCAADPE